MYAGLAAGRCCITIGVMAADAFIHCRVTSDQKALVRRLAEREGINESTLVKQLLEVVLRTSALAGMPPASAPDKINRDARLYIRLAPEDRILLKDRATARGMASATYVSLLVRSHLRDIAPLPKAEYLALKESIVELAAIGRDLNQIEWSERSVVVVQAAAFLDLLRQWDLGQLPHHLVDDIFPDGS
jgi:predicted DNA binding CopG/RHH family protein